jgi:hypothetical protein
MGGAEWINLANVNAVLRVHSKIFLGFKMQ